MKTQLSSSEEDEYESSRLVYCWWRTGAEFDNFMRMKLNLLSVSTLSPRFRLFRELERLAVIAPDGLNEIRHKLLAYRSGDFWVPTGGISKESMDIPPVGTILLVGFSGSGKSSLVNLMYSVLGRTGLVPFAQTSSGNSSNSTTVFMEEHNVVRSTRNGFCVYDSRGFDYGKVTEFLEEISGWMNDGVHHNQLCLRPGDDLEQIKDKVENLNLRSSSKFVQRRVNSAMVVANVAEIYKALKAGDLKPLEATKQLFSSPALRKSNENPILILTHGDLLSVEERMDGRLKICEHLGVSETNGVYDTVCLTEYGFLAEESDPVTAYAASEALYRALLVSDRGHFPKRSYIDWPILVLSWLLCLIAAFFALLADVFSKLGQKKKLK